MSVNKKLVLAVVITSAVTATLTAVAARHHYYEESEDPQISTRVLPSKVLGEARDLIVHLPEGYQTDAAHRYPVLYVLDGSSHSTHTAESARLMARIGVIPEIIVVGVPSSSENRARDYTPPYMAMEDDGKGAAGKADKFLEFLESELIPHVDQNYRTTSRRMLAGNSRGGMFVVYSLVEKPSLFSARFAYSPKLWRDDDRMVSELAESLKKPLAGSTFLYLSLGDGENPKMTSAFRKAAEVLRASAPVELRSRADISKGATHQTNAVLSTPVGLHEYLRTATH